MNYREMLHAVDSLKTLEILGIHAATNGAYARFPCPSKCETPAIIKTYGDKKNLWYCPKCKTGGNLLKLTMDLKGIDYPAARELLTKAIVNETKGIKVPVSITWTLEYNKWLEDQRILQSLCALMEIGQPKGRPCSPAASPLPSKTKAG